MLEYHPEQIQQMFINFCSLIRYIGVYVEELCKSALLVEFFWKFLLSQYRIYLFPTSFSLFWFMLAADMFCNSKCIYHELPKCCMNLRLGKMLFVTRVEAIFTMVPMTEGLH